MQRRQQICFPVTEGARFVTTGPIVKLAKTPASQAGSGEFESPSDHQYASLAQLAEHRPFKAGCRGSTPRWRTTAGIQATRNLRYVAQVLKAVRNARARVGATPITANQICGDGGTRKTRQAKDLVPTKM